MAGVIGSLGIFQHGLEGSMKVRESENESENENES